MSAPRTPATVPHKMASSTMARSDLPNLDVLRSFAVSLVVLAHLMMYLSGHSSAHWLGLTGVCLFFVHTCLVLMWSLERDPHTARFYIRRWFRLFPLWLVILALVVLLKIPTSPTAAPGFGYFAPSLGELFANATMTFNLHFGPRVVGASWTLPLEAQMYLLLPLLFFFVRSTRALWALILIDGLVIASVYAAVGIHTTTNATLALCIPFFLPGVMAYALYQRVKPVLPAWSFLVYLAAMVLFHDRYGNHIVSSFWCLAIGLSLPFFHQLAWRPLTQTAHLVARYSYGIYLCHIPSIWLGIRFFHRFGLAAELTVIFACVALFSITLYHLVEAPMIRFGGKLAKRVDPGPGPRIDETTLSLEPAP